MSWQTFYKTRENKWKAKKIVCILFGLLFVALCFLGVFAEWVGHKLGFIEERAFSEWFFNFGKTLECDRCGVKSEEGLKQTIYGDYYCQTCFEKAFFHEVQIGGTSAIKNPFDENPFEEND